MGQFILRRLLITIPVLVGVTLLSFFLINLAPGDAVTAYIDPITRAELGEDWVEMRRQQLGLDDPVYIRYVYWLREIVQGNLGFSLISGQAVSEQIVSRLGPTSLLMGTALLIGTVVGIPLGILSAVRQYSVLDYVTTVGGFLTISTPSFFLGLGLVYLFAVRWSVFPSSGMRTLGQDESALDVMRHMILPATVLAMAQTPLVMRYARSTMLEVLRQDYMTTARAKGLRERVVLTVHGFRNALIPLITIVGLSLPELLSGAVITETIFQWPGMGTLAVRAVTARDYPVILGVILVTAAMVLLANLLADILYAVADPRIRLQGRKGG
ncbi:MAG TPA: ABC transporter permease [Thermomicrobiales bacterium]|nr:ABC transporter permease [Thermomicrobiales bacterium]